jgi:hypothetical protein
LRRSLVWAALFGLCGCASAPLDEAARARMDAVAPVAAQYPPQILGKLPQGKGEAAVAGGGLTALYSSQLCVWLLYAGPAAIVGCMAAFGGAGAAIGAAVTPSNEPLKPKLEFARSKLGEPDVQQLLARRFSEHAARFTAYKVEPGANALGPRSPNEEPTYSAAGMSERTVVAELAVQSIETQLDKTQTLRIIARARMRLVRTSDGAMLLRRHYTAYRTGGFIHEYEDDPLGIARLVASAVDEVATLMVDDALLRWSDAAADSARLPQVTPLEPEAAGPCFFTSSECRVFLRTPKVDTARPTFRWKPFPSPQDLEAAPGLRAARDYVYDVWIFGGEESRLVEGLRATEHTLERPLAACLTYRWAVRARFDTDAGRRAVPWSQGLFEAPCPAPAEEAGAAGKP